MALILFDFDGVLADTLEDLICFGQQSCDELGISRVVTQHDLDSLDTMSMADYGRQLGVPIHLIDEFVHRTVDKFKDKEYPPKIFDGMGDVIRVLSANHKIAIVTGNSSQTVQTFLMRYNLEGDVHSIFAVDLPGSKSEKIALACNQLMVNGEDVFMVGDSASDIRAARENSVRGIGVSWGHQSVERLMTSNPEYIVYSPRELLELIAMFN